MNGRELLVDVVAIGHWHAFVPVLLDLLAWLGIRIFMKSLAILAFFPMDDNLVHFLRVEVANGPLDEVSSSCTRKGAMEFSVISRT